MSLWNKRTQGKIKQDWGFPWAALYCTSTIMTHIIRHSLFKHKTGCYVTGEPFEVSNRNIFLMPEVVQLRMYILVKYNHIIWSLSDRSRATRYWVCWSELCKIQWITISDSCTRELLDALSSNVYYFCFTFNAGSRQAFII